VVSNLRVVLNGTRSPANKLPPELLSQIFAYLHTPGTPPRHYPLEPVSETFNTSLAAVNLVCRYWRQAAIGTRELVTDIATTVPDFDRRSRRYSKGPRVERAEMGAEGDEPRTPEARPATLPAEVPTKETGPVTDSQMGEVASKADSEKPLIPLKPYVTPGPAKYPAKRREKSGIAALYKRLRDDTNEPMSPEDMDDSDFSPVGADEKLNGSKGTSLFVRGDRNIFPVSRKLKSRHRGSRTISEVFDGSGTETIPPSPSDEQSKGPAPLSPSIKKNVQKTPPTSPPPPTGATSKQPVVAHPTSMGLRERYNVRFRDKTPDSTGGPRRTRVRPRARSGSISGGYFSDSSHLSEGHQSLDDEEESKKKVDWYDAWYARRGGAGDV